MRKWKRRMDFVCTFPLLLRSFFFSLARSHSSAIEFYTTANANMQRKIGFAENWWALHLPRLAIYFFRRTNKIRTQHTSRVEHRHHQHRHHHHHHQCQHKQTSISMEHCREHFILQNPMYKRIVHTKEFIRYSTLNKFKLEYGWMRCEGKKSRRFSQFYAENVYYILRKWSLKTARPAGSRSEGMSAALPDYCICHYSFLVAFSSRRQIL